MKNALLALAMVAAVGCTAGTASAASGSAWAGARAHHAQMTDVSSARRHYRNSHHAYRGAYGSGYAYSGSYGSGHRWSGADVNAGPNSTLSFYRQHNICAIDEGYGRATRCD